MRIAFVITRGDTIGGAQIHVRDLSQLLHRQGHEVCVFMGGTGRMQEALDEAGVPNHVIPHLVHPISPIADLRAIRELSSALKSFQPDLLTAHSSKAGILARLVGKLLDIPTLFTAHGWAFTEGVSPSKRIFYRMVERGTARLARKIICVSEYDRQLALKERVGKPFQLATVHNGVPDTPFLANPGATPPRIVMVARLAEPKDHALLFQALSSIPSIHADIIGDGQKQEELERLAATLGLSERIHFIGHTPDIPQALSSAQIFVLTSNYEGFPLSILEAMRAGLPVIASDVGGVKEAVVEGVTGHLVPKGDVMALRARLLSLCHDPATREAMGVAGRKRYLEHFTIEAMVAKTMDLYQESCPRLEPSGARGLHRS